MIRIFGVGVATLALMVAGCGGSGLGTVSGVITMDGEPVPNVTLEFVPENGRPSVAKTNEKGEYKAVYTRGKNGAEIGPHKVTFKVFNDPGEVTEEQEFTMAVRSSGGEAKSFKGRSLSPSSIEVKKGKNEINFKLIN